MPDKSTAKDLLDGQPTGWVVVPIYEHQTKADLKAKKPKVYKHHELQYNGIAQANATEATQVDRLHRAPKPGARSNPTCSDG